MQIHAFNPFQQRSSASLAQATQLNRPSEPTFGSVVNLELCLGKPEQPNDVLTVHSEDQRKSMIRAIESASGYYPVLIGDVPEGPVNERDHTGEIRSDQLTTLRLAIDDSNGLDATNTYRALQEAEPIVGQAQNKRVYEQLRNTALKTYMGSPHPGTLRAYFIQRTDPNPAENEFGLVGFQYVNSATVEEISYPSEQMSQWTFKCMHPDADAPEIDFPLPEQAEDTSDETSMVSASDILSSF